MLKYIRKITSTRAWLLVASILTTQLACMVAGVYAYASWQEYQWRRLLDAHHIAYNRAMVAHTADQLAERMPADSAADSDVQLQMLQRTVEITPVPDSWELSVIDAGGRLVADRRLREQPDLSNVQPGHWLLTDDDGQKPLSALLATAGDKVIAGQVQTPAGIHLVAAQRINESPYAILVHKRLGALGVSVSAVTAPFRRVGLLVAIGLVLSTGLVTNRIVRRYENRVAALNSKLERKLFRRTSALVQTRDAVMFGLAQLADSRDQETGEHIARLQKLSALLAREMRGVHSEIDDAWVGRLRLAAALHDIGKVGVPDAILLKPGPLTEDERAVMQRHTTIGAECLATIGARLGDNDFLAMAREIALYHHEWFNGGGYPHGLSGSEIPLSARIVAVADVYDAVSSTRVYKAGQSHEAVRDLLVSYSGRQFDPDVVKAFLRVEREFQQVLAHEREFRPNEPHRKQRAAAYAHALSAAPA